MMDCKKALTEADGDIDKAVEILRVKQAQGASKRRRARGHRGHGRRPTSTPTARSACSSRSTARPTSSPATTTSSRSPSDIALHIAAAAPEYVTEEDVPRGAPGDASCASTSSRRPTSPRTSAPKIAEGKLRKWYETVVLLNQPHVNGDKYDGKTIEPAARRAVRPRPARTS